MPPQFGLTLSEIEDREGEHFTVHSRGLE